VIAEYEQCLVLAGRTAANAQLECYTGHLMRVLARQASDANTKGLANQWLVAAARWRHGIEEDRRLHELHVAYVTEGLEHGRDGPEYHLQLALLRLAVGAQDRLGSRLPAALAAVDAGLRASPEDTELLEARARLLAQLGLEEPLDDTLRRLERLLPRSTVTGDVKQGPNPV